MSLLKSIMGQNPLKVFKKRKIVGKACVSQEEQTHVTHETPCKINSSEKELKGLQGYSYYEEQCCENDVNEIFNLNILCDVIADSTVCKQCGEGGLRLETQRRNGLATFFNLHCNKCEFNKIFCSSSVCQNTKLLRAIGKGATGGAVLLV